MTRLREAELTRLLLGGQRATRGEPNLLAGDWGVEASVDSGKPKVKATVRPRFNVLEKGATPAIGSPAPPSHNLTVHDVSDLTQVDSSANPSPELHTSTIADAIATGKPALVMRVCQASASGAMT